MDKKHYQLLILGSGPAGCTAALYAARSNLNFAVITGIEQGGQLIKTPKIANWPGEPEEISGTLLMEKMMKQLHNFNVNMLFDNIEKVDLSTSPFCLQGNELAYTCDALIIAMGKSSSSLGIPSAKKYLGKGISTCAVCDGFFYKSKEVVVIGGSNATLEEALYLAKIAAQVTIINRHDTLYAEELLINQLKNTTNINLELNCRVTEILGNDQGVTGVRIKNTATNNTKEVNAQGIFIAAGHRPNTELFFGQLKMEKNYIKIGHTTATATSVPGVFAAGDIVYQDYYQAIIAAGFGCLAALDAKKFLASKATNSKIDP